MAQLKKCTACELRRLQDHLKLQRYCVVLFFVAFVLLVLFALCLARNASLNTLQAEQEYEPTPKTYGFRL